MRADAHAPLTPNVEVLANYLQPDDVIVDVGGGAGRISLPLALRTKEVINVDPSESMGAGFLANAKQAGIENVSFVAADWESAEPPLGTVALVNHVTYLTRNIVPFIQNLEMAGSRRVIITVNSPPPPSRQYKLFEMVHGEPEQWCPGHEALMDVLWEMGILPDLVMLPGTTSGASFAATREQAIEAAVEGFRSSQWSFWPYQPELERRVRDVVSAHFDELFVHEGDRFKAGFPAYGREVLITWRPGVDCA
jgi:SAM-dependent methyltransferase